MTAWEGVLWLIIIVQSWEGFDLAHLQTVWTGGCWLGTGPRITAQLRDVNISLGERFSLRLRLVRCAPVLASGDRRWLPTNACAYHVSHMDVCFFMYFLMSGVNTPCLIPLGHMLARRCWGSASKASKCAWEGSFGALIKLSQRSFRLVVLLVSLCFVYFTAAPLWKIVLLCLLTVFTHAPT